MTDQSRPKRLSHSQRYVDFLRPTLLANDLINISVQINECRRRGEITQICVCLFRAVKLNISLFQMMREMRTLGQPCGLKVRRGNLKTGTLKCVVKTAN